MKKNNLSLTKEDFSFVCPLKTEDMKVVEGGYFCAKCEKKVHDVSNMQKEEFQTLQKNNKNLCVTMHKVAAVSLVLGLSACSSLKPITGKVASNSNCDTTVSHYGINNRWSPANSVDKNQTIFIDHIEEPQLAGEPVAPMKIPHN